VPRLWPSSVEVFCCRVKSGNHGSDCRVIIYVFFSKRNT
jgi:hypothetical protein